MWKVQLGYKAKICGRKLIFTKIRNRFTKIYYQKKDCYYHAQIQEGKGDKYKISRVLPKILIFLWDHLQKNHKF